MNGTHVPMAPIIINTLYPPNQPTPRRCYELGEAVKSAIEEFPQDMRVAVVGSGGLSHFLIDEELRSWLGAVAAAQDLELDFAEYQACYPSPAGSGMGMGVAVFK